MRRRLLLCIAVAWATPRLPATAQGADDFAARGYRALAARDAEAAAAAFDAAIAQEGVTSALKARALSGRALVHTLRNQPEPALRDHMAALALESGDASLHAHRGVWYMYNGWLDQALKDFDQAIRMGAGVWGHYGRGMVYEMYGDRATGDIEYAKARENADPAELARVESEIGLFRQSR